MADALENIGGFIRERREARGWSQEQLAAKVGTSQQQIGRIESGKIKHSRHITPILEVLGTTMAKVLPALPTDQVIPRAALVGDRDFPVFAAAEGGAGAMLVTFDPVDFILRPGPLLHVKEGYGVMIAEESMVPEFSPGDIALVNPRIAPRKGRPAIFLTEEASTVRALVKTYESATGGEWRVSQWNPREDFILSKAEWPRCHAVVGRYDAR